MSSPPKSEYGSSIFAYFASPSTSGQSSTEVDSSTLNFCSPPSKPGQSSTEGESGTLNFRSPPSPSEDLSTKDKYRVPDASATSLTTGHLSTKVESRSPDTSATSSTSGQTAVHPPLSSIELDPNNPPPEAPSSKNEPVARTDGTESLTRIKKLNIQLPLWQKHLYTFRWQILTAISFSVIAFFFCIVGYITGMKEIFFGVAFGFCAACFTCVWLWISEGPPFQCDEKGNTIQPAYLTPVYIDDDPSSDSLKQL